MCKYHNVSPVQQLYANKIRKEKKTLSDKGIIISQTWHTVLHLVDTQCTLAGWIILKFTGNIYCSVSSVPTHSVHVIVLFKVGINLSQKE
jgi:hypothetical protein